MFGRIADEQVYYARHRLWRSHSNPGDREHTPRSTYSAVPLLIAPADADLPPFCAAVAIKSPGAVAIRCSREPRPLRPLNGEKGRP